MVGSAAAGPALADTGTALPSPVATGAQAKSKSKSKSKTKTNSKTKTKGKKKAKVKKPRISTPVSVDGPSPDIQSLAGVAVAPDGTGALVYLKNVGGVGHVFASLLAGHAWGAPVQVDAGLTGPSTQPVVGAGEKGKVAIAFINGNSLYQTVDPAIGQHFTPPQGIAPAATSPSLAMSQDGAAYLSFTDPTPPAHVRVAHMAYKDINFVVNPQPLNIDPTRNAGNAPGKASRTTISADGSGAVSWGEDGADGRVHSWVRRVSRDALSTAPQDLTLSSLEGVAAAGADAAQLQLEYAGSLGWGVYRQAFTTSSGPVERAFARRFVGSLFEPPVSMDGLTFPPTDSAETPQLSMTGKGDALVAVGLANSHQTVASVERKAAHTFETPKPLNPSSDAVDPQPVSALGDNGNGLVAWQQSAAAGGPIAVEGRALAGFQFTHELSLSTSGFGSVIPTAGMAAGADKRGDVVVAYLQGDQANRRVVASGDRPR